MSEWPDRLDKALEDALTSYGNAPENEGLEQRILARVNQRAIRARRMRRFTAAMSTAAVAAGCLCWWLTPRSAVQTEPATKTTIVSSKPEALPEVKLPLRNSETRLTVANRPQRSRKHRVEPKLPQFPTPFFGGMEERALLQLATYKARHATEESNYLGIPVTPIQIAAVDIKPLE